MLGASKNGRLNKVYVLKESGQSTPYQVEVAREDVAKQGLKIEWTI